MATTTAVPVITLNNGVEIPQLGFGVFQIPPEDTKQAVLTAFEVGYRHIDTAQMYGNEQQVGEAIADSGLSRDEVFVTSKLANVDHAPDDARASFRRTVDVLGHVDLFLMHWPLLDDRFVDTWRVMEEMYDGGGARAIGVSNFKQHHLNRLLAETTVIPAANQIEMHPYLVQQDVLDYDRDHQIATEAWSPIAQGAVLQDPVIASIAERLGKSTAQVVIRWHLQRGVIVFPKSVTKERVEQNFDVFDFELSQGDMKDISGLDRGERTGFDPDEFTGDPENPTA